MRIDDSRPIWAQLVEEFSRRIAAGEWAAGAKVPPVRELALELGVNPNTVQKALTEVDRLGLTTTERTAGRFVTRDEGALAGLGGALAAEAAAHFIETVTGIGLTLSQVQQLLEANWPGPAATRAITTAVTPAVTSANQNARAPKEPS